jgi:DNA-binding transcriptional LysR family regulator
MDTGLLKSFMTVARLRSFTLAGQELHLAQSTVTAHVQALERMLGTRLIDRLSSGTVCTLAGERLLPHAQDMLDLEEAVRGLARARTGVIEGAVYIATPDTLGPRLVPELMGRLQRDARGIQLSVCTISDRAAVKGLRDGSIDIAVVIGSGDITLGGVTVHSSQPLPLTFVAAPKAADDLGTAWAGVASHTFLCLEEGVSYSDAIVMALASAGQPAVRRSRFHSVETIRNCVAAGYGISALPTEAIRTDVRSGRLKPVRGPELPATSVHVLSSAIRTPTPAIAIALAAVCSLAVPAGQSSGSPV